MLKFITQRLRVQSLNEIQPCVLTVKEVNSDSEDENREVELLFKDRKVTSYGNRTSGAALQAKQKLLEDNSSFENILNERECNSSDEELLNIEQTDTLINAKRKWSRVSRWSGSGDSSSGDEEIRELIKSVPLKFSSSPPHQVQKIKLPENKTATFLANVGPALDSVLSPRKRYRSDCCKQRPSLDFEKMQQKTIVRKKCPYGVRAARTVRIRSVTNNSRIPPRLLCDPAIFSFRSLSTVNPITPVEDSFATLSAC